MTGEKGEKQRKRGHECRREERRKKDLHGRNGREALHNGKGGDKTTREICLGGGAGIVE